MKKPETKFKEKILSRLKELPNSWVVKVQQVALRGTPDILLCLKGHFVAIELKTEDGELDALQTYNIEQIVKAGGSAYVMTPDNCFGILLELKDLAR